MVLISFGTNRWLVVFNTGLFFHAKSADTVVILEVSRQSIATIFFVCDPHPWLPLVPSHSRNLAPRAGGLHEVGKEVFHSTNPVHAVDGWYSSQVLRLSISLVGG